MMRLLLFLSLAPVLGGAQDYLAQALEQQQGGHYREAADSYGKAVKNGSDSPEIRSNYGLMLHLCGEEESALAQFREALRRNPEQGTGNLFAGIVLFRLGRSQEAVPFLLRAKRVLPANKEPLLTLGRVYLAEKRYGEALTVLRTAVRLDGGDGEGWFGVGIAARGLADQIIRQQAQHGEAAPASVQPLLQEALQALSRAVALQPNSARTHLLLAESLSDQHQEAQAQAEYRLAIQLAPADPGAYLGLASLYWKSGSLADALPVLHQVLALQPQDPEAHAMLADVLLRQNNNEAARKHAQLALGGNPALHRARFTLGKLALADKHPEQTIQLLKPVLWADTDGSYHFLAYKAFRELNRPSEAQQMLAEFRRLQPRGESRGSLEPQH